MKLISSFSLPALISLLGLSCSSAALAGMLPHDSKGDDIWMFSAQGEYLKQTNNLITGNGLSAAVAGGSINAANLASTPFQNVEPRGGWGFTFELGYVVPSHKYDIRADFTFLDVHQHEKATSNTGLIGSELVGEGDLKFKFDEGEITIGNYMRFNNRFMSRLGFGAAYVSIRQEAFDNFSFPAEPPPNTAEVNFYNKFWGIGPKVTLDNQFDFNRFFSIVSGAGASLLMGEAEFKVNQEALDLTNSHEKETKVALGFDGYLGLRWAQNFNEDFLWEVEMGYEAAVYLNSLPSAMGTAGISNDVSELSFNTNSDQDYAYYGPYVGVGINFW